MNDNETDLRPAEQLRKAMRAASERAMDEGHPPVAIAVAMLNEAWMLFRQDGRSAGETRALIEAHIGETVAQDKGLNGG